MLLISETSIATFKKKSLDCVFSAVNNARTCACSIRNACPNLPRAVNQQRKNEPLSVALCPRIKEHEEEEEKKIHLVSSVGASDLAELERALWLFVDIIRTADGIETLRSAGRNSDSSRTTGKDSLLDSRQVVERWISVTSFLLRSELFLSAKTESNQCISARLQTIVIVAILEIVHGTHRSVASNEL